MQKFQGSESKNIWKTENLGNLGISENGNLSIFTQSPKNFSIGTVLGWHDKICYHKNWFYIHYMWMGRAVMYVLCNINIKECRRPKVFHESRRTAVFRRAVVVYINASSPSTCRCTEYQFMKADVSSSKNVHINTYINSTCIR